MVIDRESIERDLREYLDSDVRFILDVGGYILNGGGKRLRPILVLKFAKAVGGYIPENTYPIAYAMEYLHTASLLHDDVVDGSQTRRGRPTANIVFGNPTCVLTGDYMYSLALYLFSIYGDIDMIRNVSNSVKKMAEGQLLELKRIGDINTSMEDYFKIIEGKTAVLFGSCCYVGTGTVSKIQDLKDRAYKFGLNMGLAFQIVDDVLDYTADPGKLGKTVLNDLREGKMTYPLISILSNLNQEERDFISKLLKDVDPVEEELLKARDIVVKHGGIENSIRKAKHLVNIAIENLRDLPETVEKRELIEMATFIVEREF
ncbi:MAG: polyprenyl synthetase family protein [Hydrogenothermaceae bacterium]|nr:polyprenyl synthetase family protein [Hydrogenothermaceae bacterium]